MTFVETMNLSDSSLHTPIYIKSSPDMAWSEDKVFHLLTSDGLFCCRNHPLFRSSVPVEEFPSELAAHDPFLDLSYPKLSQRQFERVIGFFDVIGRRHGAEAAVLLAWETNTQKIELIVPPQISVVSSVRSIQPYPI